MVETLELKPGRDYEVTLVKALNPRVRCAFGDVLKLGGEVNIKILHGSPVSPSDILLFLVS